jgi:3-deoxy-D-manno-octulosonic-acid transferase
MQRSPILKPRMQRHTESLPESLARAFYSLAALILIPVLVGHLVWRGFRQPDYLKFWSERFLGVSVGMSKKAEHQFFHGAEKIFWIHAVSVGETRAAAPLIQGWLDKEPSCRVVLTHTTPTGRQTGKALFGNDARVVQRYLPYDFPWAANLFLNWARPSIGVLMETELWPNLIAQADLAGIPLTLVNARLSPRSAKRLKNFALLARPAVLRLAGIAAQSAQDAAGFHAVLKPGDAINITVVGNMKFDVTPNESALALGQAWRKSWPQRTVWLAASTREDEELNVLNAWVAAKARGELDHALLIIVPRHPQRFDRVEKMVAQAGLQYLRRSGLKAATEITQDTEVLIGDSLGEMFLYLAASDLVLIGGSLPQLGGQNPIEACAVGRPVFFGPHMFNFQQISQALIAAGVGRQVLSANDWLAQGRALRADSEKYQKTCQAAVAFALMHRGATVRTCELLNQLV